jgi:hypothetical protein
MPDWTVDEHKTVGGQSHFAEFVAGLTDAKDIKDAAVLTGALRALGTNCVNRGPSRWKMACSNSAGPECGYIMHSCRVGARHSSGDTLRNARTLRWTCSD